MSVGKSDGEEGVGRTLPQGPRKYIHGALNLAPAIMKQDLLGLITSRLRPLLWLSLKASLSSGSLKSSLLVWNK